VERTPPALAENAPDARAPPTPATLKFLVVHGPAGGTMAVDDPPDDTDTRSALLRAAYHTLCDHGYGAFSLRKVAAEADMSRGLVHYHYDSKSDLLVSLLEFLIDRFEARFEDPAGRSALDRLDAVLEWVAFGPSIFGRDGRDYFTAIFELRAQAPYDDRLRARLTANYETVRDRLAAIVREGVDDGDLAAVDPTTTATFLVTAVDGARNADLTMTTDGTVETSLSAIEQFVFRSLRST
jgi:AcrR family transcriptional regulator